MAKELPSFTVLSFNNDNLAKSLSNRLTPASRIKEKGHFKYFLDYLGPGNDSLQAKTIVIEHEYISKSFLIDYSSYYSTCFGNYERACKRIHFFSLPFSRRKFDNAVKDSSITSDKIWDSYLGYIVVKPLPYLSIGATILKTYCYTGSNKRFFSCTKDYGVNLFGKELHLNSLAFQEQDSVVGACASSALWSAFHKTSQLFQTPLPSPSDITKSAKNLFQSSGRIFPNSGLDLYQIGNAIESVGLVSELRNRGFINTNYIKAFIYAYSKMGLPILLGIQLKGSGHLICVTGYKESNDIHFDRTEQISLKAQKIERLYAHDDQIGPFSKIGFDGLDKIVTSWLREDGSYEIANLHSVIIPIHQKVRLTFENIYSKVRWIDFYFYRSTPAEIYWDIYLDFSNNYKKDVRKLKSIPDDIKYSLLTNPLPRYIWIARGYIGEECVIEFLFDATQIATADFCLKINVYNISIKNIINTTLLDSTIKEYLAKRLSKGFLSLLEKSVR